MEYQYKEKAICLIKFSILTLINNHAHCKTVLVLPSLLVIIPQTLKEPRKRYKSKFSIFRRRIMPQMCCILFNTPYLSALVTFSWLRTGNKWLQPQKVLAS